MTRSLRSWAALTLIFGIPYIYAITVLPHRLYDRDSWGLLVFAKTHPLHEGFALLDGALYRPIGNFLLVANYRLFGDALILYPLWMFALFVAVVLIAARFIFAATAHTRMTTLFVTCVFLLPVWLTNLHVTSNLPNYFMMFGTLGVIFSLRSYLDNRKLQHAMLAWVLWAATLLTYEQVVAMPLFFSAFVAYVSRDMRRTLWTTLPFWLFSAIWFAGNLATGNPKLDTPAVPENRVTFVPPGPLDLLLFVKNKIVGRFLYYYGGWSVNDAYGFATAILAISAIAFGVWWIWLRPPEPNADRSDAAWLSRRALFFGGLLWAVCSLSPFMAYRPITMPIYTTVLPFLGVAAMLAAVLDYLRERNGTAGAAAVVACVAIAVSLSAYQAKLLINNVRYWQPYAERLVEQFGDRVSSGGVVTVVGTEPKWRDLYNFDQDVLAGLLQRTPPETARDLVNVTIYWSRDVFERDRQAGVITCNDAFEWRNDRFALLASRSPACP